METPKDLDLALLRDLLALGQAGSLSRAAQLRGITHPAFGRRLRALEEWAGAPLATRGARHSPLTDEGRALAAAARQIEAILRNTRAVLAQQPDRTLPTIVIAAGRTLSHTLLPRLIADLRGTYGEAIWKVKTTSLRPGLEMLRQRQADFMLGHAPEGAIPPGMQDLLSCSVGRDAIVAVSAPLVSGYPKFALPRGGAQPRVPYLAYAPGMALGAILDGVLAAAGGRDQLYTVYEADLADSLHAMVRQGMGLAWLPLSLVREDLLHGRIVRAGEKREDIDIDVRLYACQGTLDTVHARGLWEAIGALYRDADADGAAD
ncbi:LysR family transcriptional regulator [Bordetella ansorpii]|uniref:LysR family transcriptional regulator n=1 Tax=Bordetella ansorpii TaxID=288768 RepID=A0A157S4L7_9BORD|nr:LysR family transcriptional regulator [Bordetella ansorpii]SAI65344.1 LysR family transcriptional regulator [Bordetella ansorpii]